MPTLALGLGLGQLDAEATSLLAIIPTVVAGSWRQHGYGNIRWRPALTVGAAAVAGVEAGVRLAEALPEHLLRRLFGLLLLAVAAHIAWRVLRVSAPGDERDRERERESEGRQRDA